MGWSGRLTEHHEAALQCSVLPVVLFLAVGPLPCFREQLVQQHEVAENALADLRSEKAQDRGRAQREADLGPVRYLATVLGSQSEN